MAFYCPNCGASLQDGTNFCPNCGVSLNSGTTASASGSGSGLGGVAAAAAVLGGTVLAANAAHNLAWKLTHRPRPFYTPPPPPPPPPPHHRGPGFGPRGPHGFGGPGGPGGFHGPGGPRRGGGW